MEFSGFQWDDGNWPKCGKHGLTKDDVEYVLSNNPILSPDIKHAELEDRFVAVGITEGGRAAFVGFAYRWVGAELYVRPITARYMHRKEAGRYATYRSEDDD